MKITEVYKFLKDNPYDKRLLYLLATINIAGSIYGYYWYRMQLAETFFVYWIFVPDSPLSTTLFAFSLLVLAFKNKETLLSGLSYLAVIKYGIWAVVLIADHWFKTATPSFTEAMLLVSHAGMAVEGLIYFRHFKINKLRIIGILIWFVVWDAVDYAGGLHPYLYHVDQGFLALCTAVVMSFCLVIWAFSKYKGENTWIHL